MGQILFYAIVVVRLICRILPVFFDSTASSTGCKLLYLCYNVGVPQYCRPLDHSFSTHIKDIEIVVNEVFYNLHFMLSFPVCLKEAWGKQQRQVLRAHLVQVSTLLYPERRGYTKKNIFLSRDIHKS